MKREYPSKPFAAVGAVITKSDEILLLKRRFDPSRGRWSFPGGLVELGETLEDALKREVEEEVGLKVQIAGLIDAIDNIVRDESGAVRFHYILVDYLAHPIEGELRPGSEALDLRWFRREELSSIELTNTARRLLKKIGFLD